MYPIDFARVSSLVRLVTEQVVARFFHTLSILTEKEQHEFTEAVDWLTNRITEEIVHTWNDVTTAHQAEHQVEDMYNAARTELIRQLNLHGGTVEFGPGDVQPLTDQRLGHTEAWDAWLDQMAEDNWGQPEGWYFNGEHYADDLAEFLQLWFEKHYTEIHDATVELRRAGEPPQRWTYNTFVNYFAALPQDTYVPHRVEYQRPDDIDDWHPLPPPYTADHLNIISALYEKNRFVSLYARMKSWRVRVEPIED